MPRLFTLVSIAIHAIVLVLVFVAQTFHIGPLPIPREALAYDEPIAKPMDIVLPTPKATAPSTEHPVSPDAAPIEPPSSVIPETGRENVRIERAAGPEAVVGVVGIDGGSPMGVVQGVPVPPPLPPAPRDPLPVSHQGIKPPIKTVTVQPEYPEMARQVRQEGVVILEAIIAASGAVDTVRVLRGYPLLNQAAIDAVRQWRFTPALLNGQPVPVVMTVTVNFSLQSR